MNTMGASRATTVANHAAVVGDERGVLTVWMVGLGSIAMILFAGLVYDAGNAANLQSEVSDTTWAIARAATAQIKVVADDEWVIDQALAEQAAADIAAAHPGVGYTLTIDGVEAHVVVTTTYHTRILKSIGITGWEVRAERTASASPD